MSDILNTAELAARLHVRVETIRAWIKRGEIPTLRRLGRRPILFDWAEVRKALEPTKKKKPVSK